MKFFFDENDAVRLLPILSAAFPAHHFGDDKALGTAGLVDVDLFERVADAGYEVLVTTDLAQMENRHGQQEREACRRAGLHRVGSANPKNARGLHYVGSQAATRLHGLPFVLDELGDRPPQWFRFTGAARQTGQVLQRGDT